MTTDLNTDARPVGRARTNRPSGYGRGPLLAGGVVAVALVATLITGGIGAANAITTKGAASIAQPVAAPPIPDPGDEAPGSDDPVTPPDRDSDQNGVPAQEDKVYYIQEGDTLTKLSAKFDMSVDYIADYNAVRDVDVISEGAVLRVPFIYMPPAPKKAQAKGESEG